VKCDHLCLICASELILEKLNNVEKRENEFMGTVNQGLAALQSSVAALVSENAQILADVTKLLAGSSAGPQPGQVIVNQADIDALNATISGLTAADVAEDLLVNPPAPPPPVPGPWAPNTSEAVGATITDPNGNIETASVAGVTGAVIPTFPTTLQASVIDGTVTWTLTSLATTTAPAVARAKAAKPPFTAASATMDPVTGEITHK
jgi:hypothetical protein